MQRRDLSAVQRIERSRVVAGRVFEQSGNAAGLGNIPPRLHFFQESQYACFFSGQASRCAEYGIIF